MDWLWLAFGLVAGFAMLSLMGSERQRRINDRLSAEAAQAAAAATQPQDEPKSY